MRDFVARILEAVSGLVARIRFEPQINLGAVVSLVALIAGGLVTVGKISASSSEGDKRMDRMTSFFESQLGDLKTDLVKRLDDYHRDTADAVKDLRQETHTELSRMASRIDRIRDERAPSSNWPQRSWPEDRGRQ